ncbi:MAG: hypothetical protein JO171_13300 [Paludibacterium sp.]|uniref:hypothetical protein n=1 Tax=Paludibacterium sp. TaxID=1917523 RepID=UPI0025CC2F52|nr:hypothetical protein [Paludibacterium sp.]MBV8048130.1 hypothetical protein [Paludibacterium sp.]MBV8647748.1 hypothetical protein [Paludibacterium sp.]
MSAQRQVVADHLVVKAMAGSVETVRGQLQQLATHPDQVVVLTMEHARPRDSQALAETLLNLTPVISEIQQAHQSQQIEAVIRALVKPVPTPTHMLTQARMRASAINATFADGDWLTASELSQVAGFSMKNPSAQPNKWKRARQIFAVKHEGIDYFPGYALDDDNGYRPLPVIRDVLAKFGETKSDWLLAFWFSSTNGFLGGQRPKDLLKSAPEKVIAAAEDEAMGITHG